MERRTTTVAERLRRFTNLGPCDSDGKVSLSKEVATILEDLCGEAADMIEELRDMKEKTKMSNMPPFGSIGDSVTIDELQKKYRDEQQTFSNLQSEVINPGDNCWARLPCGICRNTMMQCPLSIMQPTWSWSSSTATNQTGGEA